MTVHSNQKLIVNGPNDYKRILVIFIKVVKLSKIYQIKSKMIPRNVMSLDQGQKLLNKNSSSLESIDRNIKYIIPY